MPAGAVTTRDLRSCEGFRVESSECSIGCVEETWFGPSGEGEAVAVRTTDGRRALLLARDVLAVSAQQASVVAVPDVRLLELDGPRIQAVRGDGGRSRLAASWTKTGAVPVPPPRSGPLRRVALGLGRMQVRSTSRGGAGVERPIWQVIAVLYGGIALLIGSVIALSFLVADLVTGSPY
jgi:hypothetical protein